MGQPLILWVPWPSLTDPCWWERGRKQAVPCHVSEWWNIGRPRVDVAHSACVLFGSSHLVLHCALDQPCLHQRHNKMTWAGRGGGDHTSWESWNDIFLTLPSDLTERSVNYANCVIKRKQQSESHVSNTSRWRQCHTERKTTQKFDSWLATCF